MMSSRLRDPRLLAIAAAGCLAFGVATIGTAQAQISEDVVKLGVLSDMSSLYSDIGGKGCDGKIRACANGRTRGGAICKRSGT